MKDYVGQWFEIYRRHQEPADILFVITKDEKSEWIAFPHEKADGAGALFTIAQQKNWQISASSANSVIAPISIFKYLKNIFLFLYWSKPRRKNFWPFGFKKTAQATTIQSAIHFSANNLEKIKQAAIEKKVSLNTLLFYCLQKTIVEYFNLKTDQYSWWIPVNMRADLGLDPNDPALKKNYVSNFTIDVGSQDSLFDLQRKISESLKQKKHWGTWWWQQLGKYLPDRMIEKIALQQMQNNYYVGAFSNLGEWTCSEKNRLSFFVNPLLSHPIGAGAIIWNGELNLSLRVYPTFPIIDEELENLIQTWKKNIQAFLP